MESVKFSYFSIFKFKHFCQKKCMWSKNLFKENNCNSKKKKRSNQTK